MILAAYAFLHGGDIRAVLDGEEIIVYNAVAAYMDIQIVDIVISRNAIYNIRSVFIAFAVGADKVGLGLAQSGRAVYPIGHLSLLVLKYRRTQP